MLELKFMRENVEMLKEMLKNRNSNIDMDAFVALDAKRREVLSEVETLKRDRNNVSAEIANLKKEKNDRKNFRNYSRLQCRKSTPDLSRQCLGSDLSKYWNHPYQLWLNRQ